YSLAHALKRHPARAVEQPDRLRIEDERAGLAGGDAGMRVDAGGEAGVADLGGDEFFGAGQFDDINAGGNRGGLARNGEAYGLRANSKADGVAVGVGL